MFCQARGGPYGGRNRVGASVVAVAATTAFASRKRVVSSFVVFGAAHVAVSYYKEQAERYLLRADDALRAKNEV